MDYQDSVLPRAASNHALINTRQSSASTSMTGGPQTPEVLSRKMLGLNGQLEGTVDDRVDELYEKIGGCGLFQVFAYFAIAFGMSAPSWFIYEVGFYTQAPDQYICKDADGNVLPADVCTKDNICDGDSAIASWEADPSSDKTLDNWQQKLDLTCIDDWKIGMIGASLFLGWCVTLLWLPPIADKKGRRKIFWIG